MDIKIEDIQTLKNSRTEIGDVSELMQSIQQHGLLQPIGLWKQGNTYVVAFGNRRLLAMKKLNFTIVPEGSYKILPDSMDRANFLAINAIENLHREDITPTELGKIVKELRDANLNFQEIAVLLSVNVHRVKVAHSLFVRIPDKYKNIIGYTSNDKTKKGKIKATTAERILKHSPKNLERILEYAHKEALSGENIETLAMLLDRGMPFEKAKISLEKYHRLNVVLLVDSKIEETLYEKYGVKSITSLVRTLIAKTEPNLVD